MTETRPPQTGSPQETVPSDRTGAAAAEGTEQRGPSRWRSVGGLLVVTLAVAGAWPSLFDIPPPAPDRLEAVRRLPEDRSGSQALARALAHIDDLTPFYRVIELYSDDSVLKVDAHVRKLERFRVALPELREAAGARELMPPFADSIEAREAMDEKLFGVQELLVIESRRALAEGKHAEALEFVRLRVRIAAALARMGGSPWRLNCQAWEKARVGATLYQLAQAGGLGAEALELLLPELVAAQTPHRVFREAPSLAVAELDDLLAFVVKNPWQPPHPCRATPNPLIHWNAWHLQPGRTRHAIVQGLMEWSFEAEMTGLAKVLPALSRRPTAPDFTDRLDQTLTRNVFGRVWFEEQRTKLAQGQAWALTGEAQFRMLVVALAARLHVLRGGSRDGLPAVLFPTILTAMPADPFAPDGALTLDTNSLELHSVGADLKAGPKLIARTPVSLLSNFRRPLDPGYDLGIWLPSTNGREPRGD